MVIQGARDLLSVQGDSAEPSENEEDKQTFGNKRDRMMCDGESVLLFLFYIPTVSD